MSKKARIETEVTATLTNNIWKTVREPPALSKLKLVVFVKA